MHDTPTLARFRGADVAPHLDAVAALRSAVFRAWPYLYDGDPGYERDYLAAYAASPDSVFVLAFDGDRVVGAATGLPLADDAEAFRRPFAERGLPVAQVFYFGESVLLPAYRGRGLGHAFFDQREAHARELARFRWTAFCAVDRDPADPRRPAQHRDNDAFWRKRGYTPRPGMRMRLAWREVAADQTPERPAAGETAHTLTFWLRDWSETA